MNADKPRRVNAPGLFCGGAVSRAGTRNLTSATSYKKPKNINATRENEYVIAAVLPQDNRNRRANTTATRDTSCVLRNQRSAGDRRSDRGTEFDGTALKV